MKLILDVGAGYKPWDRATILCDVSIKPTDHSDYLPAVLDGRPFVVCDMQHLPFRDQSIDFVYSSHAVEHVADPQLAIEEMKRVGKHGCIKFPSRIWELVIDWNPPHYWIVDPTEEVHKTTKTGFQIALKRIKRAFWKHNYRIQFRKRIWPLWNLFRILFREEEIRW